MLGVAFLLLAAAIPSRSLYAEAIVFCGDGSVNVAGEECDDGNANGLITSCCSSTCKFKAAGVQCEVGGPCVVSGGCCVVAPSGQEVAVSQDACDGTGAMCNGHGICILDDGDGVASGVEDGAPNDGDGNDDGIPDRLQPEVTSLPSATGQGYITLVTSGRCTQNLRVMTVAESGLGNDPDFDYPFGLIKFELPCHSADIMVIFHGTSSLNGDTYRKYGRMAPAFGAPQFYTLPGVTFGTTQVAGVTVATASFTLMDNELGDGDPTVDLILDPSGPALAIHRAPVLSPLGLAVACVFLAAIGVMRLRRRASVR